MPTRRSADSGNSKGYFSIEIISNILLAKNTITTRQKMQPGEIKAHLSLFLLLHFGSPSQLSSGESFGNPGVAESPAHHPNLQRLTSIHTLPYPQMHLWTTGREGGSRSTCKGTHQGRGTQESTWPPGDENLAVRPERSSFCLQEQTRRTSVNSN